MQILNPDQSPLVGRAREALRQHGFESHYAKPSTPERDALLTIRGRGVTRTFVVEERRSVQPRAEGLQAWRRTAMAASQKWSLSPSQSVGFLIITEYVDEVTAAGLWAEDINFLDAAGNANIDLGGLRIEVSGRRPESPDLDDRLRERVVKAPEAGAFTAAGLPISLLLMSRPDIVASDPTMRELTDLVPSSLGKVQEVVNGLREAGLLTTGKGGRLIQGRRWLNAWTEGYLRHRHKWHSEARFSTPIKESVANVDLHVLNMEGAWLGGEAAASKMSLQLRPTTTLAYADESGRSALIRQLKLRKDPKGSIEIAGPLWVPHAWTKPWAPPVLIRADLLATGDPRQAQAAEEMMTHHEDFRRLLGR